MVEPLRLFRPVAFVSASNLALLSITFCLWLWLLRLKHFELDARGSLKRAGGWTGLCPIDNWQWQLQYVFAMKPFRTVKSLILLSREEELVDSVNRWSSQRAERQSNWLRTNGKGRLFLRIPFFVSRRCVPSTNHLAVHFCIHLQNRPRLAFTPVLNLYAEEDLFVVICLAKRENSRDAFNKNGKKP